MRTLIFTNKYISRSCVRRHKDIIFLFGDNVIKKGYGGQAKEMRGEPNCIGIPTKYAPSMDYNAFFYDSNYDTNIHFIDNAIELIPDNCTVVIPNGIGKGRANMPNTAPLTYDYLINALRNL